MGRLDLISSYQLESPCVQVMHFEISDVVTVTFTVAVAIAITSTVYTQYDLRLSLGLDLRLLRISAGEKKEER